MYLPPLDQGTEGLDAQRLLAEARLENRENQAAIAEDLSVKIACAAAEAEAAQEKARAQAEAARQANAALILLPEGEEDPSSDPSLTRDQPGPCQSDLLAQLDGVTIPDALELRVNNMLNAMASIDELIAQGLPDQAERMRSELEPLIAQLLSDLGVSPVTIDAPIFLPANPHFDSTFQTEPPGGWFYGVGDSGRTGQDSIYEWLSALVTARGQASTHGHYLLAASDEVTSLQQHLHDNAQYAFETTYLSRDEAIAALTEQGKTAAQIAEYLDTHERFMLAPGGNNGGDDGGTYGPTYGTRADYIRAIGLPEDAPLDLQISFNNSGSGSGDAWLDHSHADTDVTTRGGPERAYVALVDDHLAAEWVQIGDIGPLGDDIGKMLEDIFEDCGATTPEQQEAVRDMLFRYDERFGILANREFIAAAIETNNARRQGFFEGPVGRAIISIVAGVVGGPVVAAAVSAAITLADGGTFLDALRAGVAAYLGGVVGAEFGAWVTQTFQGALTPALTSALAGAANNFGASVVRQLITDGRLNGDALLISALGGAAGGFITNFTASSDLGQSLRDLFGDQRGARILGNLGAALVANGGRLSPADLVAALGVAATPSGGDPWIHTEDGTDIMVIEGQDGSTILMRRGDEIITMNPDGTFTLTNRDGTFPYDPTGNLDRLPGPTTGTTPAAEVSPFTPAEVATHLETFAQMNVSADDAQIFLALGLTPAEVEQYLADELAASGPLNVAGNANGILGSPVDRVLGWLGRNDPDGRLRDLTEQQAMSVFRTALGQFMTQQIDSGNNRPAYSIATPSGTVTFGYGSAGWAWFNNMETFFAENSTLLRALGFNSNDTCGPLTASLGTLLANTFPDIEFREVLRGPFANNMLGNGEDGSALFAHNFVQARILINPDAPVHARQYIYINIDPLKGEVYPATGLERAEAYVDPVTGALTRNLPAPIRARPPRG